MVAHAALVVVALLAVTGGVGAAVATGAVHINTANTFDLGTLSAGQSGSANITSTVSLNSSGYYHFEMEKEDHIGNTFSTFNVSITSNGTTYYMNGGEGNDSGMYLTSGYHSFRISLTYVVSSHISQANASSVPFLFIHPSDRNGDSNSTGAQDSSFVIHASDSNTNVSSGQGKNALAYISFKTVGAQNSEGESEGSSGTDNAVMIRPL